MMVDCWRRLYFYWKSRRNWKSVTWHYTYEWHAHKMKGTYMCIVTVYMLKCIVVCEFVCVVSSK